MTMLFSAVTQDDGLTMREIIANLPHDAAAVVIYTLVAIFIGFIWYGSRQRPSQGGRGQDAGDTAG